MSNYILDIKYTSNENKSGKVSLVSENGENIFTADVILPKEIHNRDNYSLRRINSLEYIPKNISYENPFADTKTIREKADKIGSSYLQGAMDNKNNFLMVKSVEFNSAKQANAVKGFDETISFPPREFNLLSQIIQDGNDVILVANKKWLMFGQKSVERTYDVDFSSHINLGKKIQTEETNIEFNREEAARQARKIKENIKKEEVSKKTSNIDSISSKIVDTSKQKVNKSQSLNSTSGIKKSSATGNISRGSSSKNNYYDNRNDGLDSFDLMFMTSFPNVAPFYRPNSALAWMVYFNDDSNHNHFREQPLNCIKTLPGFDGVNGCELNIKNGNTDNPTYTINLYQDEEKTIPLGVIKYNSEKGIIIKDDDGNKTILTNMDDKPGYNVLTESNGSSKAFLEVVQNKNNELVGNWTVEPKNSIPVTSSFQMNSDSSLSSDSNKTINMNSIDFGGVDSSSNGNSFKPSNDIKLDFGPKDENKYESRYEPPPPPPPEDQMSFTTSDPYSRTGYGM
jgi:hypothetical protein